MDALRLSVILAAVDRATGPFKKILAGSKGLSASIAQSRAELRRLDQQQKSMAGFRETETKLAVTTNSLKAARAKLDALVDGYARTEAPSRKMTREMERQGDRVRELAQIEEKYRRSLDAQRGKLEASGISTNRLAAHQRELAAAADLVRKKIDSQADQLNRLEKAQKRAQKIHSAGMSATLHGAGAMYAGQRAAGMGLVPLKAFADQEDAAMQLRASMMTAGGQVSAEFVKIDALAKRLGNRLPGTTTDFYEMMSMLRRQGMSAQVILGGLGEATAYLGVQLKMGYSEAAEFAAKLQDATRTTERDMMSLSDTIQRTYYLGVDPDNMLQGYSKLSPALDVLRTKGLAAAKAFAPLLVMADQAGMKGEAAGNAYRKIFQGMMDAKKQAKANALISGSGIKLDFTDGKGEFGGMQKMYQQLEKLRALNTVDRLAYLRKQFGDDAETLQALSLLITKGAAGYAEVQKKMDAQASLQKRVNAQLGTLRNLWEAATGTFWNVLATVGGAMAPQMKQLTEWLGAVGAKFQIFAERNPAVVAALGKLVLIGGSLLAVLGGLLTTGGLAAMAFSNIHRALTLLTGGQGMGTLLKQGLQLGGRVFPWLLNGARALMVVLGGISWPVLAIGAAIAVVAALVWKYWGPIKAFMVGVWQGLQDAFAPVLGELQAALAPLAPLWDLIAGAIGKVWNRIKQLFTPFQATSQQLQNATSYGRTFGQVIGSVLLTNIRLLIKVVGWLVNAFTTVLPTIQRVFGGIAQYVGGAWNLIVGIFTGNGDRIRAGLLSMWTGINQILAGWPAKMLQAGVNMVQGLINGVKSMLGAAGQAIGGVGEAVIGRFKSLLGIRSPSRVFARLGGWTMEGLAGGLLRAQGGPVAAVQRVGDRMRAAGVAAAVGAMAATPAVAMDNRPPIAPARQAAAPAALGPIEIHIHAAPGMSPEVIAQAVRAELERLQRQQQARGRSQLSDTD